MQLAIGLIPQRIGSSTYEWCPGWNSNPHVLSDKGFEELATQFVTIKHNARQ
jgi:hypothetical protein